MEIEKNNKMEHTDENYSAFHTVNKKEQTSMPSYVIYIYIYVTGIPKFGRDSAQKIFEEIITKSFQIWWICINSQKKIQWTSSQINHTNRHNNMEASNK